MSDGDNRFPICVRQGKSRMRYKVGYLNREGKLLIDVAFHDGTRFHDGLAAVRIGTRWGCIDPSGKFVIDPKLPDWCLFHEGLAVLSTAKGFGVIDKNGQFVIPPRYSYLEEFSDGLALFRSERPQCRGDTLPLPASLC